MFLQNPSGEAVHLEPNESSSKDHGAQSPVWIILQCVCTSCEAERNERKRKPFADNNLAPSLTCACDENKLVRGAAVSGDADRAQTSLLKALSVVSLTFLRAAMLAHKDLPGFEMVK